MNNKHMWYNHGFQLCAVYLMINVHWSVKYARKCFLYGFPCDMDFSPFSHHFLITFIFPNILIFVNQFRQRLRKILSHYSRHDGQLTNLATIFTQCHMNVEFDMESLHPVSHTWASFVNMRQNYYSNKYGWPHTLTWVSLQLHLSIHNVSMAGGWVRVNFQNRCKYYSDHTIMEIIIL